MNAQTCSRVYSTISQIYMQYFLRQENSRLKYEESSSFPSFLFLLHISHTVY